MNPTPPLPQPGVRSRFRLAAVATTLAAGLMTGIATHGADVDVEFLRPRQADQREAVDGVEQLVVFAGDTARCRWLIRQPTSVPLQITLDVFQATSTTAVRVQSGVVLGKNISAEKGKPVEVSFDFETPKSERPLHYVLRLTVRSGEEKNERKPATDHIARLSLHSEPTAQLSAFTGKIIYLSGFEAGPAAWKTCLTDAGIGLRPLTGKAQEKVTTEDFIFQLATDNDGKAAADQKSPSETATPAKAGPPGMRVLIFQRNAEQPPITLCKPSQQGWKIFTDATLLDRLPTSPDAQKQLRRLLTLSEAEFSLLTP